MRVLVVADAPLARAGLESIFAREGDVIVVGGTRDGEETTIAQIEEHEPDVVVVELGPHDEDTASLHPLLLGELPDGARPAVVVLAEDPAAVAPGALRGGVRGVLPRTASGEEIVAAARATAAGLAVIPAALLPPLLAGSHESVPREQSPGRAGEGELTPRELEVLRLIAEGLANKQIAGRLSISDHTVKFHVGSIFQKLGASTRTEAVTTGVRRGLLLL